MKRPSCAQCGEEAVMDYIEKWETTTRWPASGRKIVDAVLIEEYYECPACGARETDVVGAGNRAPVAVGEGE